jgi:hypothetical protein
MRVRVPKCSEKERSNLQVSVTRKPNAAQLAILTGTRRSGIADGEHSSQECDCRSEHGQFTDILLSQRKRASDWRIGSPCCLLL